MHVLSGRLLLLVSHLEHCNDLVVDAFYVSLVWRMFWNEHLCSLENCSGSVVSLKLGI